MKAPQKASLCSIAMGLDGIIVNLVLSAVPSISPTLSLLLDTKLLPSTDTKKYSKSITNGNCTTGNATYA